MAATERGTQIEEFIVETCCNCGVSFCMTEDLKKQRLGDGQSFYCPNGHSQHYTNSNATKIKRLREELERERQKIAMLRSTNETTERRRRAAQGVATKRKKKLERVANGVCPCCSRSFQNLARHMSHQHPEFHG